mmetsp:Transcript_45246/g.105563  ORF Transcript_45246/g.105563 Transcript_45246/m.105563 type:complete len:413 (+) Transcript_45246:70-1308(+)
MGDQHFEFKDLKAPKGSHVDAFHHEKVVHRDEPTTHVVDHHSTESQRLLCMEAGEGQGHAKFGVMGNPVTVTLLCCLGCCCALLLVFVFLFRLFTTDSFDSSMPDLMETCADQRELFCSVVRIAGMCVLWPSTCKYSCTDCIRFDEGVVVEVPINVNEVEQELAYAQAGSTIPESLHGIWWLDQDGYLAEKGLAGPDYAFSFTSVGEWLFTFGDDAVWQPDTQCVTPLYFWGGTGGHWAGGPHGNDTTCCEGNIANRLTLAACASDDEFQVLDLWIRLILPPVAHPFAHALGLTYAGSDYWWVPKGLVHLTMEKKSWGWDRVSRAGASWTRDQRLALDGLIEWFPHPLKKLINELTTTLRYPMWQIVDGHGNTTQYWKHFLNFTEIRSADNEDPGKVITRRRVDPPAGFKKF